MSTSATISTSKAKGRDLSKELEEGIKPWIGPSVFSTVPPSPFSPARSRQGSTQDDGNRETGRGQGTSSSPIDISSAESSPVALRPRGVARYKSPISRTAFTPPRPQPSTSSGAGIHPFFERTKSLPPPPSQRPRLVAHYSSTESSSQRTEATTTDTQSTFGDAGLRVTDRVSRPSTTIKGKERARSDDLVAGFSEEAIQAMADDFANVDIDDEYPVVLPTHSRIASKTQLPRVTLGINRTIGPSRGPSTSASSGPIGTNRRYPKIDSDNPRKAYSKSTPFLPEPPASKATAPVHPIKAPNANPISKKTIPPNPTQTYAPAKNSKSRPKIEDSLTEYFKYSKVPNPPAVVYTTDPTEVNDLLVCLKGDVFGFDLEWPPNVKTWNPVTKVFDFPQGPTALIQICDRETVLLIHMKSMNKLPDKLIDFIQDPKIFKLGVQIGGDGRKLIKDFGPDLTRAVSLLELSKLARKVDAENVGPGNSLIALTKLAKEYLGFPLSKDPYVRSGNWAGALNKEQKDYAANDVYASLMIYEKLMALSKERSIPIDRRIFCSDHGDYHSHVPRATSPNGVSIPIMARRNSSSLDPTPAQARTIAMFMEGKSTEAIGLEMGVKRTTAQSYLAEAIARIDEGVLSDSDKRRFLVDTQDNIWIKRRHGGVVAQVRAELGEVDLDGQAPSTVPDFGEVDQVNGPVKKQTEVEQESSEEEEVFEGIEIRQVKRT